MGRKRTGQLKEIAPGKFRIKIQRGTKDNRTAFVETFDGTRQDAEAFLDQCLKKLAEFEAMPERAKTVAELLNDYLTRHVKHKVRAKTLLDYENMVRRYIAPNIGGLLISEVRPVLITNFYEDLRNGKFIQGYSDRGAHKTRKAKTAVSAQTIRKVHTPLKAAFAYAVNKEWLANNPLATVTAPKRQANKPRLFTVKQREILFEKCRSTAERALWMMAYFTGARPEEYLAARWCDVDLEAAQWQISRVKVEMPGGKQNWLWEEPKTIKSHRRMPLVPRLVRILEEHGEQQRRRFTKSHLEWNDEILLFPARHNTARQTSNVNRQFKELLKQSGLPTSIRVYDLRHAFATHLLESGATLKDVSELLGHSSIRITADTYVHVSEERKQSIVNLLDAVE